MATVLGQRREAGLVVNQNHEALVTLRDLMPGKRVSPRRGHAKDNDGAPRQQARADAETKRPSYPTSRALGGNPAGSPPPAHHAQHERHQQCQADQHKHLPRAHKLPQQRPAQRRAEAASERPFADGGGRGAIRGRPDAPAPKRHRKSGDAQKKRHRADDAGHAKRQHEHPVGLGKGSDRIGLLSGHGGRIVSRIDFAAEVEKTGPGVNGDGARRDKREADSPTGRPKDKSQSHEKNQTQPGAVGPKRHVGKEVHQMVDRVIPHQVPHRQIPQDRQRHDQSENPLAQRQPHPALSPLRASDSDDRHPSEDSHGQQTGNEDPRLHVPK